MRGEAGPAAAAVHWGHRCALGGRGRPVAGGHGQEQEGTTQ